MSAASSLTDHFQLGTGGASKQMAPLQPYPGTAAGEAIVHGFRVGGSSTTVATTTGEGDGLTTTHVSSDATASPTTETSAETHPTDIKDTTTQSSPVAANATFLVDEALVATIFDTLAAQHEELVAQLAQLSETIAADAVDGVCNLAEAATTLEDTFRRIDLLQAKVEHLNHYVVQPLSGVVKNIHAPKDLKGKALNVLKSFSFMKLAANKVSSKEEDEEAMWSRIPPFVLINETSFNQTDGGGGDHHGGGTSSTTHQRGEVTGLTFAPNYALLDPLVTAFRSTSIASASSSSSSGTSIIPEKDGGNNTTTATYFKKDYTAHDDGTTNSSTSCPAPVASRNPAEFRKEVLAQSVYFFEQSTARK